MKVVVFCEGSIVVDDVFILVLGDGQVFIKIRVCGICGFDLYFFCYGDEILELGRKFGSIDLLVLFMLDVLLGYEFCGEVVEFGFLIWGILKVGVCVCLIFFLLEDGEQIGIGINDWVYGVYLEYFLFNEDFLLFVLDDLLDVVVVLIEFLVVGIYVVNWGDIQFSEMVFVVGCGLIGFVVIVVLCLKGVENIIVSDFVVYR